MEWASQAQQVREHRALAGVVSCLFAQEKDLVMAAVKPAGPAKAAGTEHAVACDVGQCVRRQSQRRQEGESRVPVPGAKEQAGMEGQEMAAQPSSRLPVLRVLLRSWLTVPVVPGPLHASPSRPHLCSCQNTVHDTVPGSLCPSTSSTFRASIRCMLSPPSCHFF